MMIQPNKSQSLCMYANQMLPAPAGHVLVQDRDTWLYFDLRHESPMAKLLECFPEKPCCMILLTPEELLVDLQIVILGTWSPH